MRHGLVLACVLVAAAGCSRYRLVYRDLEPADAPSPPVAATRRSSPWRSFFLYGWLPPEVAIDAAAECGGVARVRELRTSRSFSQGMVETFAWSGVNVYSPWTAQVVCDGDR